MPSFLPINPNAMVARALGSPWFRCSLELDFDVDAGREVELAECVDRLLRRIENVEQPLVGADLELLARFLVDVRRAVHGETLDARRQRNRSSHAAARAPHRLDDLAHR